MEFDCGDEDVVVSSGFYRDSYGISPGFHRSLTHRDFAEASPGLHRDFIEGSPGVHRGFTEAPPGLHRAFLGEA